jgi:hypothetical protein
MGVIRLTKAAYLGKWDLVLVGRGGVPPPNELKREERSS